MARMLLLLLGLVAELSCAQIIYPDEYEKMKKTSTITPYFQTNPVHISDSNNQPVQYDHQYRRIPQQLDFTTQAIPTRAPYYNTDKAAVYPTSTAVPLFHPTTAPPEYSTATPVASPQLLPQNWGNHVNDLIAKGIMKFSLNMNKAIYNTSDTSAINNRENAIFSPLSISIALSMVLLGSAGRTFDEVSRVLGLQAGVDIHQNSEIVHQMFGLLLNILNSRVEQGNGPRVTSASGIFVQEGYPIRPEFRAISENAYKSEVINLDFQRKSKEALSIINNWVNQRTMGKITNILNNEPDSMTKVILLSALYFKGEWNQHFLEGVTKRKEFFVEPNDVIEVDMMYNGGPFPFYEDKSLGVKILALPYKGLEMSMYVLLPKAEGATALKDFSDQLTAETVEYLIDNLKNQTCIIGLPRMKLSSTLSLKKALRNMGLHSLFDPYNADLSLLTGYGTQVPAAVKPLVQDISAAVTDNVWQTTSPSIQQAFPQSSQVLLQPSSQALSQALPQALPQVANQEYAKSTANNDYLIFSRFSEDNGNPDVANGATRNYFRYDDKQRGIAVEQWNTGFHIRKIRRTLARRDIAGERNNDMSRVAYEATKNDDDLHRNDNKVAPVSSHGHENTKYVSLKENRYRFRNSAEQRARKRESRQTRPMDENFLRFIQSQNLPFYGLDNLRNSDNLINPGLFASEVLHKVEMDVTERGTEAAAVTGVILERDGNQKRLVANRPFLFFIRHDPTKLVLFSGTVNAPTPNYAVVR